MKKFTLFVSVLAVAACASGSGGPDDRFKVRSSSQYFYATKKADDSNKELTTLKTEVAVCNGNCRKIIDKITGSPSHPSVLPRKSTEQQGTNVLTIYDLSDTEFVIDENTKFSFVVENDDAEFRGKIKAIQKGDTVYERNNDNKFAHEQELLTYQRVNFPLQYSDAGKLIHEDNSEEFFVGGYKELRYDAPNSDSISFTGRAAGVVKNETSGYKQDLTGDANLSFKNTSGAIKETLNMTFNNWYDVDVVNDNGTKTINFKTDGTDVADDIKFNDFVNNERAGSGTLDTNIGYYGPSVSSVKEAAGSVNYKEGDISMDAVFGTTKLTN